MDVKTAKLVKIHAPYRNSMKKRKSRVNSLFRKLYGYDTYSNYSQYNMHRKGLLEEIPSVRYEKGIIMIREVDLKTLEDLVSEHEADYRSWKVIPTEEETKLLKL